MLRTGQDGLMRSLSYAGLIKDSAGALFQMLGAVSHIECTNGPPNCFGIWPWRIPMAALADFWCGSLASTSSCLDDFAMAPLKDAERRDFLEICDDRYQRRSMILTSQMPSARLRLRMWMIFRHDYKGQRRELRRLIQSSEYSIHIAGIRTLRASMP